MRELLKRESAPALAYATAGLFLTWFVVTVLLGQGIASFATHLLLLPGLALLVMRVEAPHWARLSGLAWAGLGLLADLTALGSAAAGAQLAGAIFLSYLALLPAAAWVYGASVADEGAGRALGAAASAGLAFSAAIGLARSFILVGDWPLGRILELLALLLAIVWFAVLAKDLSAGKRHLGGPVRVTA